jgi:hypothetical protein
VREIYVPPQATLWEQEMSCHSCGATFIAETSDLQVGGFKEPGTYWFDGSAGHGREKFYVQCPMCQESIFPTTPVPELVKRAIRKRCEPLLKEER